MIEYLSPEGECAMCHCYGDVAYSTHLKFEISINENKMTIYHDNSGDEEEIIISNCPYCGRDLK